MGVGGLDLVTKGDSFLVKNIPDYLCHLGKEWTLLMRIIPLNGRQGHTKGCSGVVFKHDIVQAHSSDRINQK